LLISNIAFIMFFTSACCILSGKKVSQNNFPFFQRYLVFHLFFAFKFIFFFGSVTAVTLLIHLQMNLRRSYTQ